jgi:hypothetical protein
LKSKDVKKEMEKKNAKLAETDTDPKLMELAKLVMEVLKLVTELLLIRLS